MKCIQCGQDANYDTRKKNDFQCKKCGRPFAFEPKDDPLMMTDGLFLRAIRDVRGGGQFLFTKRQLWYALDRRLFNKTRALKSNLFGLIFAGLFLVVGLSFLTSALRDIGALFFSLFWTAIPAILFLLSVHGLFRAVRERIRYRLGLRRPLLDFTAVEVYCDRWLNAHGPIEQLLNANGSLRSEGIVPGSSRVVITDSAETAALLVANRFHLNNACTVLWGRSHPSEKAAEFLGKLRQGPKLKVFAVHNASIRGCELPLALHKEPWFAGSTAMICDLGIHPRHVRPLRIPSIAVPPEELPGNLQWYVSPKEAAWLARGNTAHLAALRPGRLMHLIRKGMAAVCAGDEAATEPVAEGEVVEPVDGQVDSPVEQRIVRQKRRSDGGGYFY